MIFYSSVLWLIVWSDFCNFRNNELKIIFFNLTQLLDGESIIQTKKFLELNIVQEERYTLNKECTTLTEIKIKHKFSIIKQGLSEKKLVFRFANPQYSPDVYLCYYLLKQTWKNIRQWEISLKWRDYGLKWGLFS